MEMTRFVSGKLVNFSVKSSFYYFNKKVYEQVEGLGMGLPLSPTFSNIFMCSKETVWRYVDNVSLFILNFINKKHLNIEFTIEHESSKTPCFLDGQ